MLSVAVVVFRETLEAALIVGIVLAASAGIPGRGRWVLGGVAGGILGAALVAAFAASISNALEGSGQEVLNASVLGAAVLMLGWHNIWMAQHGREMAAEARRVGDAVRSGERHLAALAIVVGAAVLREGSETVLFLAGIAMGDGAGPLGFVLGGAAGLATGVASGALLYAGLLRIPASRLFAVTGWLVLLLAAGLAAQAAGFLVQADLIPPLGARMWDTSGLLSEASLVGRILHTLIGYIARPAGVQVLAYVVTLGTIWWLMRQVGRRRPLRKHQAVAG